MKIPTDKELEKYELYLSSRRLSKTDYNEYLERKTKCREIHKELAKQDNTNHYISQDYYIPRYSDMLLFNIVPDKEDFIVDLFSEGLKK